MREDASAVKQEHIVFILFEKENEDRSPKNTRRHWPRWLPGSSVLA